MVFAIDVTKLVNINNITHIYKVRIPRFSICIRMATRATKTYSLLLFYSNQIKIKTNAVKASCDNSFLNNDKENLIWFYCKAKSTDALILANNASVLIDSIDKLKTCLSQH